MRGHHAQVRDLFRAHFGNNEITGIEIGTYMGDLTKSLLWSFPTLKKLYTIDPYLCRPGNGFEGGHPQDQQDLRRNHAENALAEFGDRCALIVDTSDNAVGLTPLEVSFVWIDGDHTREQVMRDVLNYYPKVVNGGIFGGHDYQHVIPFFRDWIDGTIYLGDDWTWWVIKDERQLKA